MIDVNRLSAEIGYWLRVDYWGRSIATEAVTFVTDRAFAAHELLRLSAQPFAEKTRIAESFQEGGVPVGRY